ncbi:hypothetical protein [Allochromatium vinosum]|uniref:hypothetical protein n=1 Tax=Allochromatium vinosum TaxID=1049 RepID=UPI00190749B2|nr:hypothetical protein [Allochromatium vinosum]MBK1656042.1 hypothetical protein [Allochromatium vinosum]
MSLKARLIRLERNGRPVNQRQRETIQRETLAAMDEEQRTGFESLVEAYLRLDPMTRQPEAVWSALVAERPQTELGALVELHRRCRAREVEMGIAR